MTTSDILSMSPLATSVSEALVQQKQLKIAVEEVTLSCRVVSCRVVPRLAFAFAFFQKRTKTFASSLDLHSNSNRVRAKWVVRPVASSLDM
jgi:hypothetical protein